MARGKPKAITKQSIPATSSGYYRGTEEQACMHGNVRCLICGWVSPSRRKETPPVSKCGTCGAKSQGYAQCKRCARLGYKAESLFDDEGTPNLAPYEGGLFELEDNDDD